MQVAQIEFSRAQTLWVFQSGERRSPWSSDRSKNRPRFPTFLLNLSTINIHKKCLLCNKITKKNPEAWNFVTTNSLWQPTVKISWFYRCRRFDTVTGCDSYRRTDVQAYTQRQTYRRIHVGHSQDARSILLSSVMKNKYSGIIFVLGIGLYFLLLIHSWTSQQIFIPIFPSRMRVYELSRVDRLRLWARRRWQQIK